MEQSTTTLFYSSSNHVEDGGGGGGMAENENHTPPVLDSPLAIREFFELDRALNWVLANNYGRVALQFPDALLTYAFEVATFLEQHANPMVGTITTKFYIMADTSYRSCCVDDVAAQHADCDAIVHFGDACLSSTDPDRIPVFRVFGRNPMDLDHFGAQLREVANEIGQEGEVGLLYDAAYAHISDSLVSALVSLLAPAVALTIFHTSENCKDRLPNGSQLFLGRLVPPTHCTFPRRAESLLVFVGDDQSPLLQIWLMTFVHFTHVLHYCPTRRSLRSFPATSMKQLRRRLFLMQRLRDASTVGLVVGTLSTPGFRDTIDRLRELSRTAGKKLYVFSVGKINEAKLSNFSADIDAFILLSCPFGVLLDQSNFQKPIVSAFEAEIALRPGRMPFFDRDQQWSAELDANVAADEAMETVVEDETEFSLVSGKMRSLKVHNDEEAANGCGNAVCDDGGCKNQMLLYSASNYGLTERSWKGLDDSIRPEGQEIDKSMKIGLSGVASAYESERNGNQ